MIDWQRHGCLLWSAQPMCMMLLLGFVMGLISQVTPAFAQQGTTYLPGVHHTVSPLQVEKKAAMMVLPVFLPSSSSATPKVTLTFANELTRQLQVNHPHLSILNPIQSLQDLDLATNRPLYTQLIQDYQTTGQPNPVLVKALTKSMMAQSLPITRVAMVEVHTDTEGQRTLTVLENLGSTQSANKLSPSSSEGTFSQLFQLGKSGTDPFTLYIQGRVKAFDTSSSIQRCILDNQWVNPIALGPVKLSFPVWEPTHLDRSLDKASQQVIQTLLQNSPQDLSPHIHARHT